MTRDVILGKLPSALEKPVYVVVSVITSLAIFVLLYIKHDLLSGRLGTFYDKAMLIMDSVGLGIFTSLGVMSGIDNGYPDNSFLLVFLFLSAPFLLIMILFPLTGNFLPVSFFARAGR